MWKKWFRIFGIFLLLTLMPMQVEAQGEVIPLDTVEVEYISPYYASANGEITATKSIVPKEADQYYTTVEGAGKALRAQLKQRLETVSVGFKTYSQDEQIIWDIFDEAVIHTGVPTEGDYILFHCGGWNARMSGYIMDGDYYLTLTYMPIYYTSAEQEKQVDTTVQKLLTQWNLKNANEYTKIKTVYDWICKNVTYDYDNLYNANYTLKYSGYAALMNKTAVCQGYTNLLYRLLLELGVDCRIVTGNNDSHAWNIIKLGNAYYNVDSTWDSDYAVANREYQYFMKSQNDFRGHTRSTEYQQDTFMKAYPMSTTSFYLPKPEEIKVPSKPYKVANVVGGVHVYWDKVNGAEKYGVWRSETGAAGSYKWLANPQVPHFTDTTVQSGKKYYYRISTMVYGVHSYQSEAIQTIYVGTPDITERFNKAAGIKLGWNKIVGATGYAIYRKSYAGNDAWVRVATISGNSTFTWMDESVKAKNGEVYRYTVRALAGSNKNILSGCRSTGRTMARLASRVMSSATKASATSIKCSWTTSSAVTGYEVRFMDGDKVVKTVVIGNYKTGVKTVTGLTAGRKYQVQVRGCKKVEGVGIFYSAWSVAKYVQL